MLTVVLRVIVTGAGGGGGGPDGAGTAGAQTWGAARAAPERMAAAVTDDIFILKTKGGLDERTQRKAFHLLRAPRLRNRKS